MKTYHVEISGARWPDLDPITLEIVAESDEDLREQWARIKAAHFHSDAQIVAVADSSVAPPEPEASGEPKAPIEPEAPTEPEALGGEQ